MYIQNTTTKLCENPYISKNGGVVNHDPHHGTSKNNVKIRYIQHINIIP